MDARLHQVGGSRLQKLRTQDLPGVARALVAYSVGRAKLMNAESSGVSYIEIVGQGFGARVLGSEWALVAPLLEDLLVTTAPRNPVPPAYDSGVLYGQVLGVLRGVFRTPYPTSTL